MRRPISIESNTRRNASASSRLSRATYAATFLAIAAFLVASLPASAQQRVGPSFDCGAPSVAAQPLAQVICSSEELARSELSYVIAYTAVLQSAGDQERRVLHVEADGFVRQVTDDCRLPRSGKLNREASPTEASCIKSRLESGRAQLLKRLSGEALEEAQLAPEQAIAIQNKLKDGWFLPADATVDGLLGPATRAAIAQWQRSVGLRDTGYASASMLAQLSHATPFPTGTGRRHASDTSGSACVDRCTVS